MKDRDDISKQSARHALRARFDARIANDTSELQRLWHAAAAADAVRRRECIDAIQDIAHRLAGLGGMFGHPAISDAAARLEQACAEAVSSPPGPGGADTRGLAVHIAALTAALAAAADRSADI